MASSLTGGVRFREELTDPLKKVISVLGAWKHLHVLFFITMPVNGACVRYCSTSV